jgi:hypothetical protein
VRTTQPEPHEAREVAESFGVDADRYDRTPMFTKAADGIRQVGSLSDPEQWQYDWQRSYTRDEWLDQLPTSGALTRLPADHLAAVLDGVGAAIDAMGGSFPASYTTVAVTAVRS